VQCAESLRVQAHFDGELDAVSAAAIEQHLELCAECGALWRDLGQMRTALRGELTQHRASPALRARVMNALDRESAAGGWRAALSGERRPWRSWWTHAGSGRPFWAGAVSGIGVAAAAVAAFVLMSPALENPIVDDLAAAHARSLMPSHLIDVESTDRHTVKPWFAEHADVSPVVADFADDGYRLVGGRADYLGHQRSAAVVYQHGAHVINVFSWSTGSRGFPAHATRMGFHMAFWQVGDLQYCAVSDAGWDELMGLVRLLQQRSAGDARE